MGEESETHIWCREYRVPDTARPLLPKDKVDRVTRQVIRPTVKHWQEIYKKGGKAMTNKLAKAMDISREEKEWYDDMLERHKKQGGGQDGVETKETGTQEQEREKEKARKKTMYQKAKRRLQNLGEKRELKGIAVKKTQRREERNRKAMEQHLSHVSISFPA